MVFASLLKIRGQEPEFAFLGNTHIKIGGTALQNENDNTNQKSLYTFSGKVFFVHTRYKQE